MANKILFISCALFCTFLLLFGSLPESVWWRAFRGERGKAITRDYATLPTSLSVTSRTHTRRYLKSAMGCKEKSNDNGLQPEGRLGLQVSDFHSSSFQGRQNISPYLFWLAKVGCSGQTAKYRCTISSEFLQQPSSFFLNARYG